MQADELHYYNGSSVELTVDGHEALGILDASVFGEPVIFTLCFMHIHEECLLLQYRLSEAEVATLEKDGYNRLTSKISISTEAQAE